MDILLELKNITVKYSDKIILDDVSLTIKKHDFLGIIGQNGTGKTTLLKTILGLIKPISGTIKKESKIKLGYVPQFSNFDKNFPISVNEVVKMGSISNKIIPFFKFSDSDNKKTEDIIKLIGIEDIKDNNINELSGGQLQKTLIARALMTNPDILILDEPTASLDSTSTKDIYEILHKLNKEKAIILVSHDVNVISSYVKDIACLNKKLYYHDENKLTTNMLNEVYGCPIDVISHGPVPHRVLSIHKEEKND
ncbi:metal ABC transporter ATP-binding protein [Helicovermis profundi]|uniref:ABC transporter ATP-binding protein n=1 Tax=Helicovermis profundi TaxID=3065157 RepID=A0AAU9E9H7_9FIRM|nr:ABC transporter ATP-binding protein [Clostridia bacterium S502]